MTRASRRPPAAEATRETLEARLAKLEKLVTDQQRSLEVQLLRIAELQADLDQVRGAWVKIKPPPA